MVAFERFLSRVQTSDDQHWLLKGGFALQLRLGSRARTTKDIDLSANLGLFSGKSASPEGLHQVLVEESSRDLEDFFAIRVEASREISLQVGPVKAFRFPVKALLAGKPFESFHVDAGLGDPILAPPVELNGTDLLEFAELPPLRFRAIAPVQHFAEKIHAFTRAWEGVENSRTRDLVDLMLLLDFGLGKADAVRAVLEGVFQSRKTHPLPPTLPDPPASWDSEYARLAKELFLGQATVAAAMQRLRDFWSGTLTS
jgi:hypothetical protein